MYWETVLKMLLSCKAPSFEKRWMRLLSFRFSQHFIKLEKWETHHNQAKVLPNNLT